MRDVVDSRTGGISILVKMIREIMLLCGTIPLVMCMMSCKYASSWGEEYPMHKYDITRQCAMKKLFSAAALLLVRIERLANYVGYI